jgi:hypothetical protein
VWFAVSGALLLTGGHAQADSRFSLRLGVEPLSLEPTADTPYVGGHVKDAITAYNAAATAYNRANGFPAGSVMASAPIDSSDLGLRATEQGIADLHPPPGRSHRRRRSMSWSSLLRAAAPATTTGRRDHRGEEGGPQRRT